MAWALGEDGASAQMGAFRVAHVINLISSALTQKPR